MNFLGLDPSFTRTGYSIIDTEKKIVWIRRASTNIDDKGYNSIWRASWTLTQEIVGSLDELGIILDSVIMEVPVAGQVFSGGLFMLGTHIIDTLSNKYQGMDYYTLYPNFVSNRLHGKRSYNKAESTVLAFKWIKELQNMGYEIISQKSSKNIPIKIVHDEAESFLFLVKLMSLKGLIPEELIKVNPNFHTRKDDMMKMTLY